MTTIGIDACEIARFDAWKDYSHTALSRIYSQKEIEYCLQNKLLAPQRLAVRFAIREALFKSLFHIDPNHTVPFLTLCRVTTVTKQNGAPVISINWKHLHPYMQNKQRVSYICSCTHTQTIATAIVYGICK